MEPALNDYNEEMLSILIKVFEPKIKTEEDKKTLMKMYNLLENEYLLINTDSEELDNLLPSGYFIMYINYENINNSKIKFTKSGFVIEDNNDLIRLTNYGKFWKIKKKKYIIFKKFSNNDLLRLKLSNLYNQ